MNSYHMATNLGLKFHHSLSPANFLVVFVSIKHKHKVGRNNGPKKMLIHPANLRMGKHI